MKVAIIGAGVVGLLTALEFLQQGETVSIFDQQQFGQGASWAGGGILSPMYPWRYPSAVNALAQYGKAFYQQYNELCLPVSGIDFEINPTGMLIFDESDFKIGLNYAEYSQQPMQKSQLLTEDELQTLVPQLNPQFKQALYFPELANVRNPRLLQSLIGYLKAQPDVHFYPNTEIVDFKRHHQHINTLISQKGEQFSADIIILCTGAWSQRWQSLCPNPLNIRPVHGQMVLFKTPKNWLKPMCMNKVMYLIPRQDGHLVCGSSMSERGFDTSLDETISLSILDASFEMIPELRHFPIVKQWAGLRPSSPQGIPIIDKFPDLENVWANFGHFRNGLVMAPASARLVRQLVYQDKTIVEPSAYQF